MMEAIYYGFDIFSNQDSELFMLGGESHKKKKKHSDDYHYRGEWLCFNLTLGRYIVMLCSCN